LVFDSYYNLNQVIGEKSMDMKTRNILLWAGVVVLFTAGIAMLFLSFGKPKDIPEDDINVIYTNVALTVSAQQQTLQVENFSPTPHPSSGSPAATIASPIFQQQTPALLPTIATKAGGVTSCDVAIYVSDVTIPDGTTIADGDYFTKTWKVTNTGSCVWTADYQLVYVSGDSMGGKATAIGRTVNPGESADVSIVLTSSSAKGNITGTWKLSNNKGQTFGDSLTVVVNSGNVNGTATTTPKGVEVPTELPFTMTTMPIETTEIPTNTPTPINPETPIATNQ